MTAAFRPPTPLGLPPLDLRPQGDSAIRLGWPTGAATIAAVHDLTRRITQAHLPGVEEAVPGYATVTVFYHAQTVSFAPLAQALHLLMAQPSTPDPAPPRQLEIPTLYGGDAAADLAFVAEQAHLTVKETIALHSQTNYTVAMIGFQPGFPYLSGLPEKLHMPRLEKPRLQVPAGSVAIGGSQTGVYPFAAPGGWRLIGRTALPLFDPTRAEPCLCRPGDRVRFVPIPAEEFHAAAR